MERSIDVATGESVAFTYELAGLGSRFFAVFIDLTIQVLTVVVLFFAFIIFAFHLPDPDGGATSATTFSKTESAILIAIVSFATFLLFFGYFILFEWLWGGKTPGKRLLGIRVVRDGGFPLDFTSSAIRNVVRIIEFGLGFYALSAIATLADSRNRRLGDMAAGTLVVRDNRFERAKPLAARDLVAALDEDPILENLDANERDLVRRFAERASSLNARSRDDLARRIAASIRPKLPVQYPALDDRELIEFLASRPGM
jgi:uncharacterized RDD family membrane protein YckC